MPNAYGVTVEDVARRVPGLFRTGFSAATSPSSQDVQGWINAADAATRLHVKRVATGTPDSSDTAAALAKQYIVRRVLGDVLSVVYTGNDPLAVEGAETVHVRAAKRLLDELTELGEAAIGATDESPAPDIHIDSAIPYRDLLLEDADLDGTGRRF